MKLAFYTYSYIDRLGMEPDSVLPAVAAAGYDAVDLSATWRTDEDPADFPAARRREIRHLCTELGISIDALITHLPMINALRDGRPINLPAAIDLAAELGAGVVTVHIGTLPPCGPEPREKERVREAGWAAAVDYLQQCCDYALPRGVSVATDALFPDFLTPTPPSVAALLAAVDRPNAGHNFDPCYLELCGFPVSPGARELGPRIVHAHIKDYIGRYPDFKHAIPGQGALHHEEWASALHEAGFRGTVAVECFTNMPLEEALVAGYHTVSRALAAAGARADTPWSAGEPS